MTADRGKTVKVKVSFTDDASNPETLTSTATAAVSAAANTLATGAPTIIGTAQVGQTLTAGTTAIMDADGLNSVSYTYQWIRVATDNTETNISGATASTHTLVAADQGKTVKVKVSFTDDASNAETLTSAATAAVSAAANTPATGAPTITGTAQVGQTLTAGTTAIMDADGLTSVSYTYQWIRNAAGVDTNISGATASTHTLVAADLGATIKVKVSFTDDASNAETLTSVATAAVAAAPATAPGAPTGLRAVSAGTSQINLTWTAPASTGGSAITGYQIEISSDGFTNWTDRVANTNNATTTYDHTGLPAGITRYYRVSAINATATGPVSNTAGATTAAAGGGTTLLLNFGTNASHTVEVREGNVDHRFTLSLQTRPDAPPDGNPQQPVTIPLLVTHLGGATTADYEGLPTNVTFGVGESETAFDMRAVQDLISEPGEGLRLDFGELPAGIIKGAWGPYETVAFVDGLVPSRATVDGTALVLTYDKVLNSASAPFPSDFTVRVAGTVVTVDQVRVGGSRVTLTLPTAVPAGQPVTLDYRQGDNRIRDVDGNAAVSFFDWMVTTPDADTVPPGGTDPPGGGGGGGGTDPPGGGGGGGGGGGSTEPEPEPEPLGVAIVGVPEVAVAGTSYELTAQSAAEGLVYAWRVAGGTIEPDDAQLVVWTAPEAAVVAWIRVDVTNEDGATAGQSAYVRVDVPAPEPVPEPDPEPVPALPLLGQLLLALGPDRGRGAVDASAPALADGAAHGRWGQARPVRTRHDRRRAPGRRLTTAAGQLQGHRSRRGHVTHTV